MEDTASILREQLALTRPRSPSKGWPEELRQRVARHAKPRHEKGESWKEIGDSLGISRTGVRSWVRDLIRADRTGSMMPVVVTEGPDLSTEATAITLVSPRGYRVEGMELGAVIELLGVLG